MKILFNCHVPFPLAHGGAQIQIEQTKVGLAQIGVEVDYLRWWDDAQSCDLFHHIGGLETTLIALAHNKGWKVLSTILLTDTCNRSVTALLTRALCIRTALAILPPKLKARLPWHAYHKCDRLIVGLEAERMVLERVYGVPRKRIAVVPLGLNEAFLKAGPASRTDEHLICTGTIGPAKNSLELARLAVAAQVPILFVGKPFDLNGAYWTEFQKCIDGRLVKHHPHVAGLPELIGLLQRARGYVLKSRSENWSLAAHEAAACGQPLLVPDQRWSRERFGEQVSYWPKNGFEAATATLRQFYDACPKLAPPAVRFYSWVEVAKMIGDIYSETLSGQPKR